MKHPFLVCAMLLAASVSLGAQAASQSGQYQGTSNPPPDDTITTQSPAQNTPPPASQKPSSAHRATSMYAPASASDQDQDNEMPQPIQAEPADTGTVQIAPPENRSEDISGQSQGAYAAQPELNNRYLSDPDGDIVHPVPPPGELIEGTAIRARLLDRISTSDSRSGDPFRAQVASDVFQNGQILIPAGSEIEGVVARVSTGQHLGGHGVMLLRPETVTLADGRRFRLYAMLSGAPGSRTRVVGEGVVSPDSQAKKDGIEYGGVVGAGAVTGAILGGPVGALAGTMVGAGAVTVHLLTDHPQATLESGTVLLFSLTEPLDLVAAAPSTGNLQAAQ